MRDAINVALARRRVSMENIDNLVAVHAEADKKFNLNIQHQEIARKAAKLVQDNLASKLSGIVTKALSTVFEEPIEFVATFVERRGVSECDLYLRIGDHDYDILNGQGGGIADVCSMCLQMAFIMMSNVSKTIVIDEPARHMDAVAQERFISVLQELCMELDFTIIMVTHSAAFIDGADKVFRVIKKGGISHVN